jgi:hypothetical protein
LKAQPCPNAETDSLRQRLGFGDQGNRVIVSLMPAPL